jgi:hypothetical protein
MQICRLESDVVVSLMKMIYDNTRKIQTLKKDAAWRNIALLGHLQPCA